MTDTIALPAEFEDLTVLARKWACPSENGRSQIRWNASAEEFSDFYAVFMPHLDGVLAYLSRMTLADMPDDARALLHLACAFAEASPHHELYGGSAKVPYSFDAERFVPAHGDEAE